MSYFLPAALQGPIYTDIEKENDSTFFPRIQITWRKCRNMKLKLDTLNIHTRDEVTHGDREESIGNGDNSLLSIWTHSVLENSSPTMHNIAVFEW